MSLSPSNSVVTYRDSRTGEQRREEYSTAREAQRRGRELNWRFSSDVRVDGASPEKLNAGAAQWMRYKEFEEGYRS